MNVLVIAPHPDDEVLGCGGIIAKRSKAGDTVWVCIVSEGKPVMYSEEFIRNEETEMQNAHKKLGVAHAITLHFPSAMLDAVPQRQINDKLSEVVEMAKPDEVFIPHHGDIHRDHQIVADAAMVALRPNGKNKVRRILAYETMSETDWNIPNAQNAFIPNVFEDIGDFVVQKTEALMMYRSQVQEYPAARSPVGIQGLALHRGATVGMGSAEAFMLIREVAE